MEPGRDTPAGQVVCDFCGAAAVGVDAGEVPLTWVVATENGRRRRFCDRCAREHLRSMEAKLDSEWW